MRYSVMYNRVFPTQKTAAVVDEIIEADYFDVTENGTLIFANEDGPVKAIPTGAWLHVEPMVGDVVMGIVGGPDQVKL